MKMTNHLIDTLLADGYSLPLIARGANVPEIRLRLREFKSKDHDRIAEFASKQPCTKHLVL